MKAKNQHLIIHVTSFLCVLIVVFNIFYTICHAKVKKKNETRIDFEFHENTLLVETE